ncbi:unnamed protein product [Rotaria sp. Silwood1]|nr:unnamed protein product [Rotaria sp. Silwood1]
MNSPSDILDEKSSKNINKKNVYSDIDGTFDCKLIKYADDNQTILDEIQITIIYEQLKYSLLLRKSNDESIVNVSNENTEVVKSSFYSTFHELTGNYWKYRDQFVKIPGHYYLFSDDLDSSVSSEEQEIRLNRINHIPKFISTERAFFNSQTNSIQETYTYASDGLNYYIELPKTPSENLRSSLLFVRKMVLRIGILYKHESTKQMYFGNGLLLTNRLVLTCAHNFDPIQWENKNVSYTKIYACFLDPASETYFFSNDSNNFLIEAKIIRRGLIEDNMFDYNEVKSNTTDLAILELDKPAPHIQLNEYFDPKLNSSSQSNITINSELFLIGYNGKLTQNDDLKPYRYLKDFENLTIDTLNYSHHVNNKSISIGRLIQEASLDNQYAMHDCSTLLGSSGALILDSTGKFVGIHIGVVNSRREKHDEFFFNKETFNKFVPVNSKSFCEFIHQSIIPNMDNDELAQKWLFNSK